MTLLNAIWKSTLVFLGVTSVSLMFFFISSLGSPGIDIEIESSEPGFSQLFFANSDQVFSEEHSNWSNIVAGENSAHFPLRAWRGTLGTFLRWDPVDRPSEMLVSSIALNGFLSHESVDLTRLTPSVDVSEILITPEVGASFSANSNDSQILIEFNVNDCAEITNFPYKVIH